MKITEVSVRRGVTFAMLYLIAVGFGLFSLMRLKLDLYPKMEFPIIAIISQYTGVGPFDIETVVTRPIEETVASVENVESITSTTSQGLSLVMLEFDWGTDMNQAEIDVRNNMEFIRDVLPEDVTEPMVFSFDPSTQPIIYFAVTSELHGQAELRYISEHDIEPRMERIAGVASAFTSGGMSREIRVLVDPARLRAHNISIQQVTAALQANNLQIPSGFIENAQQEFTIQTAGEYESLEQVENTSVAAINGSIIRIKDVARVEDGFKEQRQRIWENGKPAVMLMVQKQSDANTVSTCRNVLKQISRIETELPKGVKLEVFWDQSDFIKRSMSNLSNSAWQAILLTFLVLLFFLRNIRSSLIVAITIPVSIVLTFAVMDQAGLTLNIVSMAGLALAVGMLVDNSIVVLETIFRYREDGATPVDAANHGTSEVAMAITASTLTTLAVFVPILFVPGIAGQLFREMVITICFSLSVSLLVALTLIPLMSSRFITSVAPLQHDSWVGTLSNKIGKWVEDLHVFYAKQLKWALHHRKTVLYTTLVAFILSVVFIAVRGGEFMPQGDDGYIGITVDRTPGTSLDEMERTMSQINTILMESVPEAELNFSNFGQGEGIMALFSSKASAQGHVTLRLPSMTKRKRGADEIKDDLRAKLQNIPDADVSFADRGEATMFGNAGDIVIKVIGHDLQVADALINTIDEKVKTIKGVVETEKSMDNPTPELHINLDRQRIADLGLSTAQVGSVVSTSILGSVATRFRDQGNEYDIRVQFDKEHRTKKEDVEGILVMTPTGRQVPLRSIANVDYTRAPQEISREDQERIISLNIDVSGRDLRGVTRDVQNAVKQVSIPNDFRTEIGGAAEDMQTSFMYLAIAMMVAIVLVYMVMASQFESFVDPFIILFTIPMSFIGVAAALLITNTDLSVMALIGIIILVGVVVNNGIVLVDYVNQLRARGMELFEATMQAGKIRMRPVLMTAMTTILAMLPMSLGLGESGEAWAPLARAVMGGLIVATVLTLVEVPVIYIVFELYALRRREKRAAKKAARAAKNKLALNKA
ncbi:MAG TPA: efflux RND transporter permease subunit [bacterium]|nr:efflux RND transporter permease subunit [bacterium]HPN44451.1 efflux RND transporter permease subunit [bacterium]